jgi:pimeloyl-ACP methyl ester carboxylesterase
VIGRPEARGKMRRSVIGPYNSFGGCLFGDFYYPVDENGKVKGGKLPVVIFLHEYAYPTGFGRRIEGFFEKIVERGTAVLAFDMVGFGTRIEEGTLFYERYPHWSKMGRMVADVRSAVDMLQEIEFIDPGRIYAVGYSLGGTVGLYAAALDERIKGAAAVCAFTPLRLAVPEKGLEGIKAYSHLHGLIPRLGFFVGRESRLPVDFPEILASIAPRPLFASAPLLDRDACFADVKACLDEVAKVYYLYGAEKSLTFSTPQDYSRFSEERQAEIIQWIEEQLGRK